MGLRRERGPGGVSDTGSLVPLPGGQGGSSVTPSSPGLSPGDSRLGRRRDRVNSLDSLRKVGFSGFGVKGILSSVTEGPDGSAPPPISMTKRVFVRRIRKH